MQSSTLNYRNFAGWLNPPLESLSRMMGNYHVRFLGDKGGVIRLRYPTNLGRTMDNRKLINKDCKKMI